MELLQLDSYTGGKIKRSVVIWSRFIIERKSKSSTIKTVSSLIETQKLNNY